jgi:hypothetical protein
MFLSMWLPDRLPAINGGVAGDNRLNCREAAARGSRAHSTDVALKLGHSQSVVSKYESGERRLDLLELQDVCDTLGVRLVAFVKRFEAATDRRNPDP